MRVSAASSPLVYIATTLGLCMIVDRMMDSDQYLNRLEDFLSRPLSKSLFAAHPNDIAKPSFVLPPEWETWWDWAASTPVAEPWTELLGYYVMFLNLNSYSQADKLFP